MFDEIKVRGKMTAASNHLISSVVGVICTPTVHKGEIWSMWSIDMFDIGCEDSLFVPLSCPSTSIKNLGMLICHGAGPDHQIT
ncbi:hypothetical protein TNCT_624081 [Trichonephila clavata]|uniref:Uncharacterized protein n=1 Tax=Trichonephila clavata TaxID=2740835 RepID=A0A8X6LC13_TRICU|nr:hypothetical protein TNCT_624081 [Trichonephila clavata]